MKIRDGLSDLAEAGRIVRARWARFRRERSRLYALLGGGWHLAIAGAGAAWGSWGVAAAGVAGVLVCGIVGQRREG